jgi:AmmeMemoRadiSam system protein A
LARAAIGRELGLGDPAANPSARQDWLEADGASFVTLTAGGRLRGCIGSLLAWRALGEDVADNAVSAATRDPRFPPLGPAELADVGIEVSVLSAPAPVPASSRADALAQLRPGIDGVIVSDAGRRATFLPQVWQDLPDPELFMGHLLRKAGLPVDWWGPATRLERYTVAAFGEEGP